MGCNRALVVLRHVDLVDNFLQRSKILLNGLIHQNVAVSQIEDFPLHSTFQQTIDDLECGVGLSGTGRHNQQKPLLSTGNGIHRAIDGNALIVAGRVSCLAGIVRLVNYRFLSWSQSELSLIPSNQLRLCGKLIQAKFPFFPVRKSCSAKPSPLELNAKGISSIRAYSMACCKP